jgi:putative ABC transport system permease protein
LTLQIAPPSTRYDWDHRPALYDRIVERLKAIPGVDAVGLTTTVPFSDMLLDSSPFSVPGAPDLPDGQRRHATAIAVTPDYFRAMTVTLLRGRAFTDADRAGAPKVVIIDEQLATQYFPNADPVGRVIDHFGPGLTIVGVVRSVNQLQLGAAKKANVYYPLAQMPFAWAGIVVHSRLSAASLVPTVRAAVREIDPELPVYDVQTMSERIQQSLGARKLAVTVLGGFAGLALLLALLGTYGVLSYSTSQRTRELGIRMALGARPGDVIAMVLRSGLALAATGLVIGIVVYLGIGSRVLRALVYGVSPADPATLAAGFVVLAASALIACWIPARRASTVDPAVTLRAE